MRFARFQKKLGINLPGIYSNVLSRGGEVDVRPLKAAVRVLRVLGVQPGYLAEDEPCCGAPLNHAGLRSRFADNARRAFRTLETHGVKKIIGVVPYCTHALSRLFPLYVDNYNLEVSHFLEIVADKISTQKLKFPRKVKITYHDPCQLVRYLDLVEEPRRVLRAIEGVELVEPEWTKKEWATCCGGGGGFEAVFPELSRMLGINRARELLETGADIIATHCPGCVMQLKEGVREAGGNGVEVLDITEIIDMALTA
jgi:heterodisulfide reductase subunit D